MSAATNLVYRPILVTQRQFPRLNRFSTFKLDFSRKFLSRTSISHSTRYPLPPMMDSVKNQGAAGDEGVTLGGLEQEALSMNIGSGGIEAALNSLSKWLIAAVFGIIFFWKHDMEAVWATSGGIINICLSIVLKRILNQERPVSTLRSDPGMPSSHAHYIFYTLTFCIHSMIQYFGLNGITAVVSAFILVMGSYFSWLRVSQQLHTLNQVAVGAVIGFCFSIFWL
ncbi:lipid phosphate phosphatase epsilon 2, chloroplastic-like [Nicotiana tabacum]|uniref:Lipid phosphate phosphatase epsilon 2, chloroplastic-like n=1 Tax=Nicotiana tabacum TaxID=4097 RepID=A0AC58U977_TOBAC